MNRLTKRVGSNVVACTFDMDFVLDMSEKEYAEFMNLMEKLANYEDAEEEGRLVILPCKVGDTVYEPRPDRGNLISVYTVVSVHVSACSVLVGWILEEGIYSKLNGFEVSALGKTVFLTRSEAEEALEKMKGETK